LPPVTLKEPIILMVGIYLLLLVGIRATKISIKIKPRHWNNPCRGIIH